MVNDERANNNARGPWGEAREQGAKISNISHFFLSEQKKGDGNGNGNGNGKNRRAERVNRVPPERHPYPPPQQTGQSEQTDPSCLSLNVAGEKTEKRLEIISVISSHLRWDGAKGLSQFARLLTKDKKTVGVLKLQNWSAQFTIYHPRSFEHQVANDNDYSEDLLADGQPGGEESGGNIFDKLDANIDRIDSLILTWGPEFTKYHGRFLEMSDKICLITTPADEHLVGTYQAVKQLMRGREDSLPIGIFVAHSDNPGKAKDVSRRFIRTAEEHLRVRVDDFGYLHSEPMVTSELIFRDDIRESSEGDTDKWVSELEGWVVENNKTNEETSCRSELDSEYSEGLKQAQGNAAGNGGNNDISIIDIDDIMHDESEQFLSLHIGKYLLAKHKPTSSDLIDFLRSMKLRCARFTSQEDGQGDIFVVTVLKEDDPGLIHWAMEYYPTKTDSLMLLSEIQLGQMEKAIYERNFPSLQIVPIIRGRSEGRERIVVRHPSAVNI